MALSRKEAFARLMEHMCRHDGDGGHGYSQTARWGNGTTENVDLGDGVTVQIQCGDRDCSSGIVSCLRAVGIDTKGATYTGNMRAELLKTGLFDWHPMGDGYIAQRGDIYLSETHHTAMCTSASPDMLAQFSISELGKVYGKTGDQTARESNIRSYYSYPWNGKLAWKGDGGSIGSSIVAPPVQNAVKQYADCRAVQAIVGAVADNIWGPDTGRRVGAVQLASKYHGYQYPYGKAYLQRIVGTTPDGVWGRKSAAAHDECVKRIQTAVGVAVDGIWGKQTDAAVHKLHLDSHHTV